MRPKIDTKHIPEFDSDVRNVRTRFWMYSDAKKYIVQENHIPVRQTRIGEVDNNYLQGKW